LARWVSSVGSPDTHSFTWARAAAGDEPAAPAPVFFSPCEGESPPTAAAALVEDGEASPAAPFVAEELRNVNDDGADGGALDVNCSTGGVLLAGRPGRGPAPALGRGGAVEAGLAAAFAALCAHDMGAPAVDGAAFGLDAIAGEGDLASGVLAPVPLGSPVLWFGDDADAGTFASAAGGVGGLTGASISASIRLRSTQFAGLGETGAGEPARWGCAPLGVSGSSAAGVGAASCALPASAAGTNGVAAVVPASGVGAKVAVVAPEVGGGDLGADVMMLAAMGTGDPELGTAERDIKESDWCIGTPMTGGGSPMPLTATGMGGTAVEAARSGTLIAPGMAICLGPIVFPLIIGACMFPCILGCMPMPMLGPQDMLGCGPIASNSL